ncbi:hypothetical protein ACFVJK_17965, partial [Streptomyces sp. NPDC127172]|uniref:GntT/GntP/DsdX family permease n=1 Tax=Streptomyces sp. NPDC127172 TaxID=3345382 RepID=UPI00363D589B
MPSRVAAAEAEAVEVVEGFDRESILKFSNDCLGPIASILLVIGAGGAFNNVLIDSG